MARSCVYCKFALPSGERPLGVCPHGDAHTDCCAEAHGVLPTPSPHGLGSFGRLGIGGVLLILFAASCGLIVLSIVINGGFLP